jgi:hypothetical protein
LVCLSSRARSYQPLGPQCRSWGAEKPLIDYCKENGYPACCRDPCSVVSQYSMGNNELNYVTMIDVEVRARGAHGCLL